MTAKENEIAENKLDNEFRKILRIIKPYIPCIMNNEYLFSYRMWLEKLNETKPSEKVRRNKYLMELCRQIQDGILEKPFNQLPLPGPLPKFNGEDYGKIIGNVQNSGTVPNHYNVTSLHQNTANINPKVQSQSIIDILKPQINVCNQNSNSNPNDSSSEKISYGITELYFVEQTVNKEPTKPNTKSENALGLNSDLRLQENRAKKLETIAEIQSSLKSPEEESSWCDLSELSSTTITKTASDVSVHKISEEFIYRESNSPNKMYEIKILGLLKIISKLKEQNLLLQEKMQKCEKGTEETQLNVEELMAEISSLKSRLKELSDIKTALKNTQLSASTQWQDRVNALNKKFHLAQNQNNILRSDVEALEKKLQEYDIQKEKDENVMRKQLEKNHSEEIELLKKHHTSQMTSKESKFERILHERENMFSMHLNKLKQMHEDKLQEIGKVYDAIISDKSEEICKLTNILEKQGKKLHHRTAEVTSQTSDFNLLGSGDNAEKVEFMLKLLSKTEKLFKKREKEYVKQINKLRRELALREKFVQLQLRAKKAELVASSSTMKHLQMDDVVLQLEERYKKLLGTQKNFFETEKLQDMKLISELRTVITKNYIDNHSPKR